MILYRCFFGLLSPLLALMALVRVVLLRESLSDFAQRLGMSMGTGAKGSTLWVHAASNGELASAESLIRLWIERDPDLHVLVTTNSTTGRALAHSWALPRLHAQLAAFDVRWAAQRLIGHWNVSGLVIMEAEFWPNRIGAAADKGLPVIVLGARLSRKSAKGWRRLSALSRKVLTDVTHLVPQDHGTPRRLKRLGLDPRRIGEVRDLKSLYSAAGRATPDPLLTRAFPRTSTWLAASTHDGEDETLVQAHIAARATQPDLRFILALRHAHRAAEVRKTIEAQGLICAQRSLGETPEGADVYLVDTMGEMSVLYELASVCFVAGSLVDKGGHTPFEPIAHDCALLHGPYTQNFLNIYRQLDSAGAARQVDNSHDIAAAVLEALREDTHENMTAQARKIAQSKGTAEALALKVMHFIGRGWDVI